MAASVQDDERERELVRLFNLKWDNAHQRSGVDAELELTVKGQKYCFDVEVKSTTAGTVSTARDVGMDHIAKWRRKFFVIGFYSSKSRRPELKRCLCLTPIDMEPWIGQLESYIKIDFALAQHGSRRLGLDDLAEVCGLQDTYSVEDAKRLQKSQWTAEQYAAAADVSVDGKPRISQDKMLEILQLRLLYIAERGATLNNPHIGKRFLDGFVGKDREVSDNWAASIRTIATSFVTDHPDHAASVNMHEAVLPGLS